MDELYRIYKTSVDAVEEMREHKALSLEKLKAMLKDKKNDENKENAENAALVVSGNGTPATKRVKRLSALEENEEGVDLRQSTRNNARTSATVVEATSSTAKALEENEERTTRTRANKSKNTSLGNHAEGVDLRISPRNMARTSATVVKATSTTVREENITEALELTNAPVNVTAVKSAVDLMPPPAAPTVSSTTSDLSFSRPQRQAKLNCEKHLKEPKLNNKMRRPTETEVQVKLEHEQRASQMHETELQQKKQGKQSNSKASIASTASQDSVIVLPNKAPSIVTIPDQSDQSTVGDEAEKSSSKENTSSIGQVTRELSVRIKREKISTNRDDNTTKTVIQKEITTLTESSVFSTTTTATAVNTTHETTAQGKKGQRKKKTVPRPIKVERLSNDQAENEPSPPVSARTRGANNSLENNQNQTNQQSVVPTPVSAAQSATIYEETNDNQQWQQPMLEKQFDTTKHINTPPLNNETITITTQNVGSISGGVAATNSGTPTNATMVLGAAPNDATYCTAAASTFVVDPQNQPIGAGAACSDLTFDVASASKDGTESQRSSYQSMATARDTLQPRSESLMTEDESDQEILVSQPIAASKKPMPKMNTLPLAASKKAALPPAKSYKFPVREIFNPLIQSPVKKKVEAFESVAAANKNTRSGRSRLAKENSRPQMSTSSSATTPLIGKPSTSAAASSNRFCTPTQNLVTPNAMVAAKKFPASASKATGLTKSSSADKIWFTNSAKAPSREHSAEDFRRGTQQLAEERKKQRDQRHLQAAQQREAKERERAERLAKAAKEREEKRLKKQQLAEQKQRELQEIQRKLKQQEEAAAAAAAAEVAAQREKLAKLAMQQNAAISSSAKARMPPPLPKTKYTFEMLHEDDSTDDEGKVTYKRPPPPTWSLSHVRGPAIQMQQHVPNEPVDFLFSVQPRTLDLQTIFPKIDPRYLKRNSSAIWQTPPRYSELPKY